MTEEKKVMNINFKKDFNVDSIIKEYCETTGYGQVEFGIHVGIVTNASKEVFPSIGELNQTHFYMGIWYALHHKKNLLIKYLTEKQMDEEHKKEVAILKHIKDLKKTMLSDKNKAPYIG